MGKIAAGVWALVRALPAAALSALAAYLKTPGAPYTVAFAALFPGTYLALALILGAEVHWWFVAVLPLMGVAYHALGEDTGPRRKR